MKLWITVLFLILCNVGFPVQLTFSGGSPSTTTFVPTNTQSRAMACAGNVIEVLNQTDTILAIGIGSATSAPSFDYKYVPAGPNSGNRFKPKGGLSGDLYIYVRTPAGAETTGTVEISCTTEET